MRPFRNDRYRGQSNYTPNAAPTLNNQLQDLDMEMEILKRQREIIKQRQMGSGVMTGRQNTYNYPSSSFDNYQNFGSSNKTVEKSYKRASDRNWPSTSAPKQPRQINPWQDQYDSRPNFKSQSQPIRSQGPPFKNKDKPMPKNTSKPRPDFNPTKVTKAKNVLNKPNTNIPNAAKRALTDTKAKKVFGPNEILRPFKEPTPSMKGRLELALGEITKDIKRSQDLDKPVMDSITFAGTQRQVKNVIRQRITSIMMNKIVGPPADIIALYRKSYPDVVDEEIKSIINSAPAIVRPPAIKPISAADSGDIRTFFKSKISRLLTDKMQEMIDNLGKLYGDNEKEIIKCIIDLPDLEETVSESNDNELKENKADGNISNDKVETSESNDKMEASESNDKMEGNKSNAEENKDSIVEDVTEGCDNAEKNKISEENTDDTGSDVKIKSSDADKQDTAVSDEKEKTRKVDQYYKLMDLLIINRLPKLLVKFKDNFANIMYCEKDFIIAKEMIMKELKDKLRKSVYAANSLNSDGTKIEVSKTSPIPQVNEQSDAVCGPKPASDGISTNAIEVKASNTENNITQDSVVALDSPPKTNNEQLFVMLLGRPSLPSKEVIYEFLNKFKPQSIKKHKTVNNLLVISFNNKQDYDNILAANESKVGDSVFIIKANEVMPSEKPSNADVSDGGNSEKTTKNVQDGEVMEEIKENSEMTKSENMAQIVEDKKMETIVEIEEKDEVQIIEEESDVTEGHNETKNGNEAKNEVKGEKDVNVATPVRSSSRLANVTPSTIKTRRASRLAQNN